MTWLYWALASAFFAGLTAIFAKIGVEKIDSNLATALRTTVALFLAWGLALATVPMTKLGEINSKTWLFLTLSGLATGLSWICYFHAMKIGTVARVASVDKLSVVIAIVFSLIFLHEKLNLQEMIGATVVVIGTLVMVWK